MRSNKCMNQTSARNNRGNPLYVVSDTEKIIIGEKDEPKNFGFSWKASQAIEKLCNAELKDLYSTFGSLLTDEQMKYQIFNVTL